MAVGHYENFPVASLLLPAPLRQPVQAIYRFARSADDFADEGSDPPDVRLARLDAYRAELEKKPFSARDTFAAIWASGIVPPAVIEDEFLQPAK